MQNKDFIPHISIIEKLKESNVKYNDLRALFPKDMPEIEVINYLREVNANRIVKSKINNTPHSYRKMPSTVQTYQNIWKDPKTGNEKKIKIVGFRHGMIKINQNSRDDVKKEIGDDSQKILLVEQGMNGAFKRSKINIKGHDIHDQIGYIKKTNILTYFITILFSPITLLIVYLYRFARQDSNGLHCHPDEYPKYQDYAALMANQLPEDLEIELHKILPPKEADKLDEGYNRHNIMHGRSGYMAGYIIAVAEKMANSDKEIIFACGGAHLPRIASYLKLGSRENIPPSLLKDFNIGYEAALKDFSKDKSLFFDSAISLTNNITINSAKEEPNNPNNKIENSNIILKSIKEAHHNKQYLNNQEKLLS